MSHFLINIRTLNPEVQLELLPLYVVFYFKICRLTRTKIKLCKGTVFSLIRAWLALAGLHLYLPALSEPGEQERLLNSISHEGPGWSKTMW